MNFFYRIGIGLIVCSAVACSKDETETAAPVAEPETVVIGCSGAAGVDADVRTQLAADGLSVRWASGDEIRFWAREHKEPAEASPTYIIEKEPFRFDYYSPSWSRAGFTGTISGVESKFDRAKTYDYFAVSPAPADDAVSGTRVTYTIPALQEGDYDGLCDIMTAQLPDTTALQAGDNNPSINLKFKHHIHLLRFKIESNAWEKDRPVRAVELTFPCAVVGALTVDAADSTVNVLAPEGEDAGKKLLIKFPAGKERKVGETFYAMIVPPPTAFGSDAKIGMRIIGTLGETSDDVSVAGKTFEAGHTTPVKLKVKEMTTRYNAVTLTFNVTDGNGGMGENTLGERVKKVRVKGLAGAFSKAVDWSEGCSVSEDGSELTCTVPSTGGDGIYSLTFLPDNEENSGYLWPGELWDSSIISNKTLEVEYESERAVVKTLPGWKPVQTSIPSIPEGQTESYESEEIKLSVPYLVEQDFSTVEGFSSHDEYVSGTDDFSKDAYQFLNRWTAGRAGAHTNTSIRIACRQEIGIGISGTYSARVDSAPFDEIFQSGVNNATIKVIFDWGADSQYYNAPKWLGGGDNDKGQTLYIGYVTEMTKYKSGDEDGFFDKGKFEDEKKGNPLYVKEKGGAYTNEELPHLAEVYIIPKAPVRVSSETERVFRLVWRTTAEKGKGSGNTTSWLYLDNIKVQLAPEQ